jgi:ubiquinone biosynthesis protein
VLKIRRPDIRKTIEADLRLLTRLALIADQEVAWLARFRPIELVKQFAVSLRQELDLAAEGRNADRVAENFAGDPRVRVPKIYWEWTCERLNVQEYVPGIPARDLAALANAGLDPKLLASRGTHALLKMMLQDGFFHADPHAGNLFAMPDNEIVIIDWGMVGRVSEIRRRQVIKLLLALIERDAGTTTNVLLEWAGDSQVNEDELRNEVEAFIDCYHGVPLKQLNLLALLGDVTQILRQHHLSLPTDMALMIKAVTTIEGLGRLLNPDFQIADEAEPVLRRLLTEQYTPDVMIRRGWDTLREGLDLLAELPREIRQLTLSARRGHLRLGLDVAQIDRFGNELNRAANRLTIGLITSACILGAAIIAATAERNGSSGMTWLGLYILAGAGIGGLWVLISIWRSGRQ